MAYMHLKSGTDIRGVASEGVQGQPVTLSDAVITGLAGGFLTWCQTTLGKKAHTLSIALGHDSRISASRISNGLKAAFTACGVQVYDCGLASTPAMFMAVLQVPCDAAVEITASHHPFHRNGLKFFTKNGGLESADITQILTNAQNGACPPPAANGAIHPCSYMQQYSQNLREMICKGVNAANYTKPLQGFRLVVDAGNGAGGFYATQVLAPLGADINGSQFLEPDGRFPNHVPNPEDPAAMAAICKATLAAKADLGIIFDTDVDRAGAVGADGAALNRNTLVALAAAIALQNAPGGTIVTDSITSDGLKQFIEQTLGGKHHRFQRGYKNVINEALRLNAAGINCPLAIETSGHAALRENYFLDDGAYLITKIIILLASLGKQGKSLTQLLAPLHHAVEEAELRFPITAPQFPPVGEAVLAALTQYAKEKNWQLAQDSHEGVRISFPPQQGDGWLLLRMSVHDPILPLNIESNRQGGATQIATHLHDFFCTHSFPAIDQSALIAFVKP